MKNTLLEALIEAGYPNEQVYHHCSDLYIFVTPLTKQIVDKWFKDKGLKRNLFVSTFQDQVTGQMMYDCAFQYDPFWQRKEHLESLHES